MAGAKKYGTLPQGSVPRRSAAASSLHGNLKKQMESKTKYNRNPKNSKEP
jgi:hypothetical protein